MKPVVMFLTAMLLTLSGCAKPDVAASPSVGNYVYRLGPGDKLRIMTYGEDRLSGEFSVSGDGSLAFPLLGTVPAKGKTIVELRDELIRQLGTNYLRNPRLTAEIVNFRPVYVLGEVTRPGEFAYVENMSVFAVIAKAGGFTYRANQKRARIRHEGETRDQLYALSSATAVQPGDTIIIDQKFF